MPRQRRLDLLDWTFEVGIVLKGLDGVLEAVGGIVLLVLSPATINRLAFVLTRNELSQDPQDFIATHVLHTAHGLSGSSVVFGAVYLLSHGAVKIVLVTAVLKAKLWAYPWMIGFLVAFICYQGYRIAVRPTFGMSALTVFDAAIVWLTWREYGKQRARARVPAR